VKKRIPPRLIAIIASLLADCGSHKLLENLLLRAGLPHPPLRGTMLEKAQSCLERLNDDANRQPLVVLGRIVAPYLDRESIADDEQATRIGELRAALDDDGLRYIGNGTLVSTSSTPSRCLEDFIKDRDLSSVNLEFERGTSNIETNPREALSAACNILESVFKTIIEEEGLTMPRKRDLKPVWAVVRDHLNLHPEKVSDRDIKAILSSLAGVVDGLGAYRTHASSAHGAGKKMYKLEPRHARLAVHAAHTIALFVLETWNKGR